MASEKSIEKPQMCELGIWRVAKTLLRHFSLLSWFVILTVGVCVIHMAWSRNLGNSAMWKHVAAIVATMVKTNNVSKRSWFAPSFTCVKNQAAQPVAWHLWIVWAKIENKTWIISINKFLGRKLDKIESHHPIPAKFLPWNWKGKKILSRKDNFWQYRVGLGSWWSCDLNLQTRNWKSRKQKRFRPRQFDSLKL